MSRAAAGLHLGRRPTFGGDAARGWDAARYGDRRRYWDGEEGEGTRKNDTCTAAGARGGRRRRAPRSWPTSLLCFLIFRGRGG